MPSDASKTRVLHEEALNLCHMLLPVLVIYELHHRGDLLPIGETPSFPRYLYCSKCSLTFL